MKPSNYASLLLVLFFACNTLAFGDNVNTMRAVVATEGTVGEGNFSKVLVQNDHAIPSPGLGQVVIRVLASSVNPVDWKILEKSTGLGLRFPHTLGFDVSGTIYSVGTGVTKFKNGDAVWADLGKTWLLKGGELGAYAEFALADASQVDFKPKMLTHQESGVLPLVGLTALQAYRMTGAPNSAPWNNTTDLTVLVTSGSGGTGQVGIQMAKAYGAKNIISAGGPDSLDLMKSWGATKVIDYHKGSVFSLVANDTVDIVFDNFGAPGTADDALPVLRSGGVFIFLPGKGGAVSKKSKPGVKQINYGLTDSSHGSDLEELRELCDKGDIKPYVQETFELGDAIKALETSFSGHVIGKLGIYVKTSNGSLHN